MLFSSERCVISEAAAQLMEVVHQTLKDVCLSSATVALEFYHAARDALLLYEAVIPVKVSVRGHLISHLTIAKTFGYYCGLIISRFPT